MHRVRITLAGGAIANALTAVTDVRGIYELAGVPAGSYSMTAARAGYLTVQYGQRQPREAGRPIEIADRQVVDDLDIALPRAATVSGRLLDELGEPAAGVRVEVMDVRYSRGRLQAMQAGASTTNDIGQFRIGGLDPGNYYLRAESIDTWESDDGRETYAYAQTFYPGVAALDQTRSLTVPLGEHLTGLDFHLVPSRAARIIGTLVSASGEPIVGQRVSLDRIARGVGGGLASASMGGNALSGAEGRFVIRNIPPGEYMLYSGTRETEEARLQIFVAGADIDGVTLSPRRATTLAGVVVTEDGKPADFPAPRVRFSPIAVDEAVQVWGTPPPQSLRPDWTFQIVSIYGRFLFRLTGLPDGWALKAVRFGERDVTDAPIDIAAGAGEIALRLVIGRVITRLAGRTLADPATPHPGGTVVVFSADSAQWLPGSRFVRATRTGNDGRFEIVGLPPGAYLAAATDFVMDGAWEDPDFLRSLSARSVKIMLAEGDTTPITLMVSPP